MIRNPSRKPATMAKAVAPATVPAAAVRPRTRIDAIRILLHGAGIDPRTFSAIEAELTALAKEAEEREADIAILRLEKGLLEGQIASAAESVEALPSIDGTSRTADAA